MSPYHYSNFNDLTIQLEQSIVGELRGIYYILTIINEYHTIVKLFLCHNLYF